MNNTTIYIVTGIPRSGTSLMMQMFQKFGFEIMHDNQRNADISNPNGYYEYAPVKGIIKSNNFLKECEGKVVKIVTPLPMYLDLTLNYKIVFMRRDIEEILMSQERMIGKDQSSEREKFKLIYAKHLQLTKTFFENNKMDFLEVNYNNLLNDRESELTKLCDFLQIESTSMDLQNVIDPKLYRNKN